MLSVLPSEKCRGIWEFAIRSHAALASTVAQCIYNLWWEQFKCIINPLMVTSSCTLWGFSGRETGICDDFPMKPTVFGSASWSLSTILALIQFVNFFFFFHENFLWLHLYECQCLGTKIMFLLLLEGDCIKERTGSYLHLYS